MSTIRTQLVLTEMEGDVIVHETRVDRAVDFREIARYKINLPPRAPAKPLTHLLTELGPDCNIKGLLIISDVSGVIIRVATDADLDLDGDNVALLHCHPFLFIGEEQRFSMSAYFQVSAELPLGDETAHLQIVAYS